MTDQNLILDQREAVTVLTINRPKAMNPLDPATLQEMENAIRTLNDDPTVNVMIITGAGRKAFVAGGDIAAMQPLDPVAARGVARKAQGLLNLIEYSPKISIAAINGYALGGGCELAMACDIRLAADTAKLGQPEINLGIIPGWGGTQRLARLVGKGKAKELMLTGNLLSAEEAERIGLVNRVVAADSLLDTALEMAATIAEKPQVAARLIKEGVNNGLEMPVDKAFDYEAELFGLCFATDDQKEGMAAFLEKRQAVWKNR